MKINQITLLELNRHQNIESRGYSEEQMRRRHRGRSPECEEPAQIEGVADMTVRPRRPEFELSILSAHQKKVNLSQPKKVEVVYKECARQD